MKRIVVSLLVLLFTLSLSAQETDSILLEKVDMLKKELAVLQKKNKSLQGQVYKLQKGHVKDMDDAEKRFAASDEALQKYELRIAELTQAQKTSEERSLESVTILGEWTKKMIIILAIVSLALILVLLILILTIRRRIDSDYGKLEAKVDNTREDINLEIKNVLKRLEEEISALKTVVEKGKK